MIADFLEPSTDLLREEYVLVQAWKKTALYIRYHNWYSDTLELDRAAVDLPRFLNELADSLRFPEQWTNDPLRIVPAPKSQTWRVSQTPKGRIWGPISDSKLAVKLRPLAHVSLKDQVAATALMLCLANRVETTQGDPRASISDVNARGNVISYGNRLFCEGVGASLRHPWGSERLYREYYQDYQKFLSRPGIAAASVTPADGSRIVIVHSDLRQFYDRVRPSLLKKKLDGLKREPDDPMFFALAARLLNWEWHKADSKEVATYAKQTELSNFSSIALPQGLVAAGFFANVVLLDFDEALRGSLLKEIKPGIRLDDICRYVDDLRIVLSVDADKLLPEIEEVVAEWLQELLDLHAEGLRLSPDKTAAAVFRNDERPLVQQSRKMARIQSAISGGFDAIRGEEILEAVQGLIRSQERYSEQRTTDQDWPFSPIPDVRDETVARFAAARFRTTYRSLRPLLFDRTEPLIPNPADTEGGTSTRSRSIRSQAELDDEARAFALGLIENWVEDPSNVRLLRIGLDLWPAEDVLRGILALLLPFTEKGRRHTPRRLVACYCLSEIFRAGATETGFVESDESFPTGVDVAAYRMTLYLTASQLAAQSPSSLPWYLRQQVLLFLAANAQEQSSVQRIKKSPETRYHLEMVRFLGGQTDQYNSADFALLAILSRRSFCEQGKAAQLVDSQMTRPRLEQIAQRDPSFACEILSKRLDLSHDISPRLRDDLCLERRVERDGWISLSRLVLHNEQNGFLREELAILQFASQFLSAWQTGHSAEAITPSDVLLKLSIGDNVFSKIEEVKIAPSRVAPAGSMYQPPNWCPADERWRFQLGYLMRFILTARPDFTRLVRKAHWKETTSTYRIPESHWYQRIYGLFNGQSAFGDDWLPISDWTELLLLALLRWPGCRTSEKVDWVWKGIDETRIKIEQRVCDLSAMRGASTGVLMLPLTAPRPERNSGSRPLRACVVQTVIPTPQDLTLTDLTFSGPAIRKRHRNHLSAALAAIERMLDLRETHTSRQGRLDWLILPELSVHPRDIKTHLEPFARKHKTIILAGLTYQELFVDKPLVNSAIWVIPVWSQQHGLQVLTRRQGKHHLAHEEDRLNATTAVLQGFRPCQWLIGYEWSSRQEDEPLRLTSSICYDATDIRLAADLRHQSDVFAILALNKDVTTFDQMALALHYHMFQMVIVANNGLYGGSNAYVPYRESYVRQVFHLHGQPQASIAFLEIDPIAEFITRRMDAKKPGLSVSAAAAAASTSWKFPPAGI